MQSLNRPKISIKRDPSDWIIEIAGALFMLLMIGLPIYYFNQLPDTIPSHFNALGEPDAYSKKNSIWTLPIVGLFTYIGLFALNGYPHIFNYPTEITEDNAERQYRIATKLLRTMNLVIAAGFAYITYSTIQAAFGNQMGLGMWFLPIFLLSIFGTTGVYLYSAFRKKS